MSLSQGVKHAEERARSLSRAVNLALERQARLHSRAMITARHGRAPQMCKAVASRD